MPTDNISNANSIIKPLKAINRVTPHLNKGPGYSPNRMPNHK